MEPHTTSAGALLGTLTSIPLALLPGVQGNALWVGMIVAFCITFLLDSINTPRKSGAAVVLASLSSGYGSASASNWLAISFPMLVDAASHDGLRMISAILIAAAVPILIAIAPLVWPVVLQFLTRFLNRKGDAP